MIQYFCFQVRTEGGAHTSGDGDQPVLEKRKRTRRKRRPSAGGVRPTSNSEAGNGLITSLSSGGGGGASSIASSPARAIPIAADRATRAGSEGGGTCIPIPGAVGKGSDKALPTKKKDYASWAAATPEYRAEASRAVDQVKTLHGSGRRRS